MKMIFLLIFIAFSLLGCQPPVSIVQTSAVQTQAAIPTSTFTPTFTSTPTVTPTQTLTPLPTNTSTPTIVPTISSLVQPTLESPEFLHPENKIHLAQISLDNSKEPKLTRIEYYFKTIAETLGWGFGDCRGPENGVHLSCLTFGDTRVGTLFTQPESVQGRTAAGSLAIIHVIDEPQPLSINETTYGDWYFLYTTYTVDEKYYGEMKFDLFDRSYGGDLKRFYDTFVPDPLGGYLGHWRYVAINQLQILTADELIKIEQMNNK